jgi:parallel beta-helix repeat protein
MNKPCLLAALPLLALAAPLTAKTIAVGPSANNQEALQTALIEAMPGDVVELAAGRYTLSDGLSLDVDRVTVRGAGPDKTVLDFKGQKSAGEGLLVTADDVVLRGFAVEDARGDAIKSKGADRIVYHDLRVEWTGGPKETNGAYGIYPVSSTDVLIDKVVARGASDAGIYVGQSKNIVVRNSVAEMNVAGIEIENSYNADVHDNIATKNTGGVLVFDLPDLPQMGGHSVRIFNNRIVDNSTPNFAPKGNIVASVPSGTGVMVMANRNVHVFGNTIADNSTSNVMVVAYKRPFTDKTYNQHARPQRLGTAVCRGRYAGQSDGRSDHADFLGRRGRGQGNEHPRDRQGRRLDDGPARAADPDHGRETRPYRSVEGGNNRRTGKSRPARQHGSGDPLTCGGCCPPSFCLVQRPPPRLSRSTSSGRTRCPQNCRISVSSTVHAPMRACSPMP